MFFKVESSIASLGARMFFKVESSIASLGA